MKNIILALLMSILTLNVFAQPSNYNFWIDFSNVEFNTNCYITNLSVNVSDSTLTPILSELNYNNDSTIHSGDIYYNVPFGDTLTYHLYIETDCGCYLDTTFLDVVNTGFIGYHTFYFGTSNPQNNTSWTDCFVDIRELSTTKKVVRIIDETGRDAQPEPNKLLIYVYDDGTIERKVIIKVDH
jgi:hypothetical protein